MLMSLILFLGTSLVHKNLSCKYIELTNVENRVIAEYVLDGVENNFFPNDMGIVMMTVGVDTLGRKTWHLQIEIEDRYKSHPPEKWTTWGTYMILIRDEKDTAVEKDSVALKSKIKCLEEIIGDRLYTHAPPSKRYVVWPEFPSGKIVRDKNGRPKVRSIGKTEWLGNKDNQLFIIFNSDGTIQKGKPS